MRRYATTAPDDPRVDSLDIAIEERLQVKYPLFQSLWPSEARQSILENKWYHLHSTGKSAAKGGKNLSCFFQSWGGTQHITITRQIVKAYVTWKRKSHP